MLTCPSSLTSPSRSRQHNTDSIPFTNDHACLTSDMTHFLLKTGGKNNYLVTNSKTWVLTYSDISLELRHIHVNAIFNLHSDALSDYSAHYFRLYCAVCMRSRAT